jgi:hypothetical protein
MMPDPREADEGKGADMPEQSADRPLTKEQIASLRAEWNKLTRGKRRNRQMKPASWLPGYKTR